jgi:hypothetical protein
MLIVTAVVAVCLGLWANSARRQQRVVQSLEEKGCEIFYSYQMRSPFDNPALPGPTWVREWLGVHYFDFVQAVNLKGDRISDADLASLRDLPRLTSVHVFDAPNVTDAGLAHLAVLNDLDDLYLKCPQITDAGLVHLHGLHLLEYLYLESDQITNAGLVHLRGLNRLRLLSPHCAISDAGMEHLTVLTRLERLLCMGAPSDKPRRALTNEVFHAMSQIQASDWPLGDVCDYLGDFHGIKVRLDEDALTATPVDRTTRVNTDLVRDRLHVVLGSILEPHDLGWYIGEVELVITTDQIAAEKHAGLNKLRAKVPGLKEVRHSWYHGPGRSPRQRR